MAKISAHDIFREVKSEIFNLRNKGELEVPITMDNYTVPTEDDMLKAYWQGEDKITVQYKGQKRLIPCPISTKNDEYIARCIMQGFAQICLGRNGSKEHLSLSKNDALQIAENTITRLVNEGLIETSDNDDYDNDDYYFINDNNDVILDVLKGICGNYPHYVTCDIDRYDAFVDFSDLYIIVSLTKDGYIYVSKVEGSVLDSKQQSIELWKEVGECINKINSFNKRLSEVNVSESRERINEIGNSKEGQRWLGMAARNNREKAMNAMKNGDFETAEKYNTKQREINGVAMKNPNLEDRVGYGEGWREQSNRLSESTFKNNQGYSHFAVNKDTKKIVNGWDYKGEDPEDLKQFKHDYFTVDLIDYGFDPKQYRIYTDRYLRKNGINPDDNNNWANS